MLTYEQCTIDSRSKDKAGSVKEERNVYCLFRFNHLNHVPLKIKFQNDYPASIKHNKLLCKYFLVLIFNNGQI